MANKKEDKVTKVAIVKTSKLTLTEINALAEKIISDTNDEIQKYNASVVSNPEYKRELKKIKTSTGILAAERALVFIKQRHKKVQIQIISTDFNKKQSDLYNSFTKKKLEYYTSLNKIKNELILSQINNKNMFEIAEEIKLKLIQ